PRCRALPHSLSIISAAQATQRLPVYPEVISDLRDRRARPRAVQRDRVGLELDWVVLVHHRVPKLLSTRTIKIPVSGVQDQGTTPYQAAGGLRDAGRIGQQRSSLGGERLILVDL